MVKDTYWYNLKFGRDIRGQKLLELLEKPT